LVDAEKTRDIQRQYEYLDSYSTENSLLLEDRFTSTLKHVLENTHSAQPLRSKDKIE